MSGFNVVGIVALKYFRTSNAGSTTANDIQKDILYYALSISCPSDDLSASIIHCKT